MAITRMGDGGDYTIDSGPYAGRYGFGALQSQPGVFGMTGGAMPGPDPFAYTGGSLLTPWTKAFTPPQGVGGAPQPFQGVGSFQYGFQPPDAIRAQQIAAPEKFSYADFAMPTAETMQQDPGYAFRQREGQRALETAAAAKGVLRTGGTLKDILSFGQDLASQEYGNAYNRSRDVYGLNRGNAAENWDRNWGAQFQQQAANAGNALRAAESTAGNQLQAGQLGYQIAAGEWDRNTGLKRQQYDDALRMDDRAYGRALDEYGIDRENFLTAQNNQFGRLMQMGQAGNPAGYAGSMADLFTGQGNANAAGAVGGANAWTGALSNIGGGVMDAAALWQMGRQPAAPWAMPRGNGLPGYVDPATLWTRR